MRNRKKRSNLAVAFKEDAGGHFFIPGRWRMHRAESSLNAGVGGRGISGIKKGPVSKVEDWRLHPISRERFPTTQ